MPLRPGLPLRPRPAPPPDGDGPSLYAGHSLYVVRRRRHYLRRGAHRPSGRRREVHSAEPPRVLSVSRLVLLHRGDDGARARVARGQAIEVPRQMRLQLPLGLGHAAEADATAPAPGEQAHRERTGNTKPNPQGRTVAEPTAA